MDDFNTMDTVDKESLGLKVGDKVRLTGPGWGGNRDRVVPVDMVTSGGRALYEEDNSINSLTEPNGKPYGETYAIEVVERVPDELVDGVERTYSTDEIVSAIRSLTEAGVYRELAVKVVSDRVQAGGEL